MEKPGRHFADPLNPEKRTAGPLPNAERRAKALKELVARHANRKRRAHTLTLTPSPHPTPRLPHILPLAATPVLMPMPMSQAGGWSRLVASTRQRWVRGSAAAGTELLQKRCQAWPRMLAAATSA